MKQLTHWIRQTFPWNYTTFDVSQADIAWRVTRTPPKANEANPQIKTVLLVIRV